jgi:hypothetical protein
MPFYFVHGDAKEAMELLSVAGQCKENGALEQEAYLLSRML